LKLNKVLKYQDAMNFLCPSAWKKSAEISHSATDSDARKPASNILHFKPRPIVASRTPHAALTSDIDSFFNTLAAAMTRKSVPANMESF
jgi:hypothetical protein